MDPTDARHDCAKVPGADSALKKLLRRITPSRRRLQFRLRTMLAAVAVLCLLLGLLSKPIVEARRDRRTADALRTAGAEVAAETVRFPGATVIRLALGDWVCQRTCRVRLPPQCAGAEELRLLAGLEHVHMLDLREAAVTDAGLEPLARLDELELLNLGRSNVTDAGLRHLRGLESLTYLYLSETKIGDAGLAHLAGLDALAQLDLRHTEVTDAGLEHLAGLARLESLGTFGTRVSYAGLARLEGRLSRGPFREMRAREEIGALGGQIATHSGSLIDQGETVFFETAYQAYLDGTQLSGDALAHVRYLDALEEAELANLALGEEGLAPLAELPMLQVLTLRKTAVDEQVLRSLTQMNGLRRLSFYDNEITDAGLEQLAQLDQLESLELHGTGVTEDAAELLRKALPGCTIQVSDGD